MPTYDYVCDACGASFEIYHSITEPARTQCPSCGEHRLRRLIGTGGALIFKGAGFYATDYRKSGSSRASESSGEPKGKAAESTTTGAT